MILAALFFATLLSVAPDGTQAGPLAHIKNLSRPDSIDLAQSVAFAQRRFKVPAYVTVGVIEAESDFRPRAARHGDYGLMQVRLSTAREILPEKNVTGAQLLDIRRNVLIGAEYISRLHAAMVADGVEAPDDYCMTLMAYNIGPGATRRASKSPLLPIAIVHYVKVRIAVARWQAILK